MSGTNEPECSHGIELSKACHLCESKRSEPSRKMIQAAIVEFVKGSRKDSMQRAIKAALQTQAPENAMPDELPEGIADLVEGLKVVENDLKFEFNESGVIRTKAHQLLVGKAIKALHPSQ